MFKFIIIIIIITFIFSKHNKRTIALHTTPETQKLTNFNSKNLNKQRESEVKRLVSVSEIKKKSYFMMRKSKSYYYPRLIMFS